MSLYGNPSIMEWLVIQYATGDVDDRLTEFLDSFKKKGRFSIEFGFFTCTVVWNSRSKKHTIVNIGERRHLGPSASIQRRRSNSLHPQGWRLGKA